MLSLFSIETTVAAGGVEQSRVFRLANASFSRQIFIELPNLLAAQSIVNATARSVLGNFPGWHRETEDPDAAEWLHVGGDKLIFHPIRPGKTTTIEVALKDHNKGGVSNEKRSGFVAWGLTKKNWCLSSFFRANLPLYQIFGVSTRFSLRVFDAFID